MTEPQAEPQTARRPPLAGQAGRILVVDDDAISCEVAKWILERYGFEVIVADSAATARRALQEQPPSLVLMDVHIGRVTGIDLVAALRNGEICIDSSVPVIMVTSDRTRGTLFKAIDLNIQGYILKPYLPDLLVDKVESALAASKADSEE